jgi:hypothetical protein
MNIDHEHIMLKVGVNGGSMGDHCHPVIIVTLMFASAWDSSWETVVGIMNWRSR